MNINTDRRIVMKKKNTVFVLSLILASIISLPAEAVVVVPSNVVIPVLSGETFSFDLIIDGDPAGYLAVGYQSIMSVSGGGLSFDAAASQAVDTDAGYWIVGNSAGVFASEVGGNYLFGDSPSNPGIETLLAGDIMARYAFTWDGTVDDYTFTLDLDSVPANSFTLNGSTFSKDPLEFTPGQYPGDVNSFTVSIIPEPASIMLLVCGAAFLRKSKSIKNRKV